MFVGCFAETVAFMCLPSPTEVEDEVIAAKEEGRTRLAVVMEGDEVR